MNANESMKLPAECTPMTEEEMIYTHGGTAAETAARVIAAVGGAAVLLIAGGIAARSLLSFLGGEGSLSGVIDGSVSAGKQFIDGAVDAGQNLLDSWMGL